MTEAVEVGQTSIAKPSRAWLRALEMTAPIARNPHRIIASVVSESAGRHGDAPALLSETECLSYQELNKRSTQYSQWAIEQGITKGDVVGLLMSNRPEYFAIWVGITAIGGVVALLNSNLTGTSLAHSINVVRPTHVIVEKTHAESLSATLECLSCAPEIWIHGCNHPRFRRIDLLIQSQSGVLEPAERPRVSVHDLALHIYTSGTTGLPKAANITHARIMQWAFWFAGMLDIRHEDRMYNCLPMYHSIGGVVVPGAVLAAGGSVAIRETFSVSQFWNDLNRWDCTLFQYIGEFCRYLFNAPLSEGERRHSIRLACGNGMSPDVWLSFQERFKIPRILEFYASTEGGLSLFNVEGEPGAIGRVPPYLAHRFSPELVRFDAATGEPLRDGDGFCIPCVANEPGEALARVSDDPLQAGSRFEGYTDADASERKLLRNVFRLGDTWFRTGDLMRKNEQGFFFFVDRIGDTFRWKGENVATTEVAAAISSFRGVQHAIVYGVKVPGADGRIGMATICGDVESELAALRRHLINVLPSYARPAFIRLQDKCEVTGTFKYSKSELQHQGYNPVLTADAIYFDNPETQALQPLDRALYHRIQAGEIRL
jgi:fatty-acyl-CoA synthase